MASSLRATCAALRPGAAGGRGRRRADRALQVTDPYIEMRTGPGRGYPVFFVAGAQEWIEIELRNTDWYRVRTDSGKDGWVQRLQLETTLTAAGGKPRPSATWRSTTTCSAGSSWEPRGASSSPSRCSSSGPATGSARPARRGDAGPGPGRLLGHRLLACEPEHRALGRPALSPFFAHRLGKLQEHAQRQPGRRGDRPTPTSPTPARPALAPDASASSCAADYTLYTAFVSDSSTANTAPSPPACRSSSDHHEPPMRMNFDRPARCCWPPPCLLGAQPRRRRRPQPGRRRAGDRAGGGSGARCGCRAIRRRTSRSAPSWASTARRTSAPAWSAACASATTSPRTSSSKATYGQTDSQRRRRSARSCPAASSRSQTETLNYYNVSVGYNVLPGEVFIGSNCAKASAFYLIAGIGSTRLRRPAEADLQLRLRHARAACRPLRGAGRRARPLVLARPARQVARARRTSS